LPETPRFVEPMLATAASLPLDEARWSFEVKWDGVRVIARIAEGRLELRSRRGGEVTPRYPELASGAAALGDVDLLLDGEVVALDESGRPSFELLQRRMHVTDAAAQRRLSATVPVRFVAFDVLWAGGASLLRLPYRERRLRLVDLGATHEGWMTPAASVGAAAPILDFVTGHGLEGVVAKRLDSTYQPGTRSGAWIKQRSNHRQELLVCGWIEGTGQLSGTIGSLVVGYHDGPSGPFRYAGRVGSGLSRREIAVVTRKLVGLERPDPPFDSGPPGATDGVTGWVEPLLVVEVEFTDWTQSGVLRQPVFLGVRDDRDPSSVVREPTP